MVFALDFFFFLVFLMPNGRVLMWVLFDLRIKQEET